MTSTEEPTPEETPETKKDEEVKEGEKYTGGPIPKVSKPEKK